MVLLPHSKKVLDSQSPLPPYLVGFFSFLPQSKDVPGSFIDDFQFKCEMDILNGQ